MTRPSPSTIALAPSWRRYLWLAIASVGMAILCDAIPTRPLLPGVGQWVHLVADEQGERWVCDGPSPAYSPGAEHLALALVDATEQRIVRRCGAELIDGVTGAFLRRRVEVSVNNLPNSGRKATTTAERLAAYRTALGCNPDLSRFPGPGESSSRIDIPALGWGLGRLLASASAVLFACIAALRFRASRRWTQRWASNRCTSCGYPLAGASSGKCPECGAAPASR
jgi:hypothetical protein